MKVIICAVQDLESFEDEVPIGALELDFNDCQLGTVMHFGDEYQSIGWVVSLREVFVTGAGPEYTIKLTEWPPVYTSALSFQDRCNELTAAVTELGVGMMAAEQAQRLC